MNVRRKAILYGQFWCHSNPVQVAPYGLNLCCQVHTLARRERQPFQRTKACRAIASALSPPSLPLKSSLPLKCTAQCSACEESLQGPPGAAKHWRSWVDDDSAPPAGYLSSEVPSQQVRGSVQPSLPQVDFNHCQCTVGLCSCQAGRTPFSSEVKLASGSPVLAQ